MTRGELLDRIAVLLGGRAAEEELLSDISTGAQDDLQRATQLVRRMCSEFGMSQALGLQAFDSGRGQFLDVSGYANREVSDETARAVDRKSGPYSTPNTIASVSLFVPIGPASNKRSKELQEHEVLDGERFREIVLGDVRGS